MKFCKFVCLSMINKHNTEQLTSSKGLLTTYLVLPELHCWTSAQRGTLSTKKILKQWLKIIFTLHLY